jgi:hypothetical protein
MNQLPLGFMVKVCLTPIQVEIEPILKECLQMNCIPILSDLISDGGTTRWPHIQVNTLGKKK